MPLYREDFDHPRDRCTAPGCDHTLEDGDLYIHSVCHPSVPTWARYRGDVLTIECAACERVIGSFVIASREQDP
jgi:hypothetical protein